MGARTVGKGREGSGPLGVCWFSLYLSLLLEVGFVFPIKALKTLEGRPPSWLASYHGEAANLWCSICGMGSWFVFSNPALNLLLDSLLLFYPNWGHGKLVPSLGLLEYLAQYFTRPHLTHADCRNQRKQLKARAGNSSEEASKGMELPWVLVLPCSSYHSL